MKHWIAFLLLWLPSLAGFGQTPELVKDLNVNVGNTEPDDYGWYQALNATTKLFWADNKIHGAELWKTDGTEAGSTSTPCASVSLVVTRVGNQIVNPASSTVSIGSSLTLSAIGCTDGQAIWSTGDLGMSVSVTPSSTTTYVVTCTSATSCTLPSSQSTVVAVQLLNLPAPTVGALPASICVGKGFAVPYSTTGVYPAGNIFSVELSDTLGAWTNTTVAGVLPATSSGTINAFLPDRFIRHGGYRLRVVATASLGADPVGIAIEVVSLCSSTTITESCNTSSVQSGAWHDPATWSCGQVPGDEDEVTITASHTVTVGNNLKAVCQVLKQHGKLVFRQGSKLQITSDSNAPGPVKMRGPAVLKPGLLTINEASIGNILWVNGNHIRFRGALNSVLLSGSSPGGRQAAPQGLLNGSFMLSKPTKDLPYGWFGKVEQSFTVNGTTGIETEVVFAKADYSDVFDQLDIGWQAKVKISAKIDFEGKIKGKDPEATPAKEVEVNGKGTVKDTAQVTFDFGLKIVNSVIESFSVNASVDNNIRVSLESSGKISYKLEQLLYH